MKKFANPEIVIFGVTLPLKIGTSVLLVPQSQNFFISAQMAPNDFQTLPRCVLESIGIFGGIFLFLIFFGYFQLFG